MDYNVIEESLGALKKINSSGEVESLGNVWHTDRPFNVFPTRMLSIEGDLHLCAAYGNLDELLRFNSLASQVGQCGAYRVWEDAALCASHIPTRTGGVSTPRSLASLKV